MCWGGGCVITHGVVRMDPRQWGDEAHRDRSGEGGSRQRNSQAKILRERRLVMFEEKRGAKCGHSRVSKKGRRG